MVHILCADISGIGDAQYQSLYRAASPQRQQRADQYRNQMDSVRCITGEVLLRIALAQAWGCREDPTISYTEHGKPYLKDRPDFHFSISHSGKLVLLAYGKTQLGVDIQQMDPKQVRTAVAKRFFTPEEQAFLSQGDPDAFFRIWTGKESYLKYLGTGLSKSLSSFCVLSPEENLHYFWETLDGHMLCLCTRETAYCLEQVDIKNAPA